MKHLRIYFLLVLIITLLVSCTSNEVPEVPPQNEIVLSEGMAITATNDIGTIEIKAGKGLERSYTWNGATRSVIMWPRKERWQGKFGIYYPGPGNHWKKHDGITRGVLEESQINFPSVEKALEFIHHPSRADHTVYTNDGLVVSYEKLEGAGGTLAVGVFQVLINRKKPKQLKGSKEGAIKIKYKKV